MMTQQNRSHQKQTNIRHVVIHYLHSINLITTKTKHDFYRGRDYMKVLWKSKRARNTNNQLREKENVTYGKETRK